VKFGRQAKKKKEKREINGPIAPLLLFASKALGNHGKKKEGKEWGLLLFFIDIERRRRKQGRRKRSAVSPTVIPIR